MSLIGAFQKYRTCCDVIVALGLIISMIIVIMCTCMMIKNSNKNEEFTTKYIVQVSVGLSVGVVLLSASIIYFCIQYKTYNSIKKIDDFDSDKYKLVEVLGGSHCAICLNEKDTRKSCVVSLSCRHEFHKQCAQQWIDKCEKTTCPVCRKHLDTVTKSQQETSQSEQTSFIQSHSNQTSTSVI